MCHRSIRIVINLRSYDNSSRRSSPKVGGKKENKGLIVSQVARPPKWEILFLLDLIVGINKGWILRGLCKILKQCFHIHLGTNTLLRKESPHGESSWNVIFKVTDVLWSLSACFFSLDRKETTPGIMFDNSLSHNFSSDKTRQANSSDSRKNGWHETITRMSSAM